MAGEDDGVAAPAQALWLRGQLLDVAAALHADRRAAVVREWTDPVRLRGPEPVGRSHLFLVAAGGVRHPASSPSSPSSPSFRDVLDAFTAAGWQVRGGRGDGAGGSWARAAHGEFAVRVHAGEGAGLLTLTGWTPVLFTGRELRQPPWTRSTVDGVLCDWCQGWGVCLDCEGTTRLSGRRCWCAAANAGPGTCVECGGTGRAPDAEVEWRRRRHRPAEGAAGAGASPAAPVEEAPVEEGHDSALGALADVAHRTCACGEFRCLWRSARTRAGERLLVRFTGACQSCAAERAYAFALPLPPPRQAACQYVG
ncbi:hypothetical protein [Streptomyces boncukensis]|uniref:Uncharacterized protein n=1 Tax=Streptomyces boncukensis TaxID=2711219 RepID=A0A6G4X6A5_9ACTN|nr:hypothetical protein [Streptomyces boncukensis]NGO72783.1 hypothetical protein [Streptomyces boncukensis]